MIGPSEMEMSIYKMLVAAEDEEAFLDLFATHPNVLWGDVTSMLSPKGMTWVHNVLQKKKRKDAEQDEYDNPE